MVSWRKQLAIGLIYMVTGFILSLTAYAYFSDSLDGFSAVLSIIGLALNIVGIYMVFRAMITYIMFKKRYVR